MIRRVVWTGLAAIAAAAFYYLSRFYDFRLWTRDSPLTDWGLRPEGGLLAR